MKLGFQIMQVLSISAGSAFQDYLEVTIVAVVSQ